MLRTSNQFRHQTESGTKRSRRASNEVVLASIHRQILVPFYEIQIQTQIQLQILTIDTNTDTTVVTNTVTNTDD